MSIFKLKTLEVLAEKYGARNWIWLKWHNAQVKIENKRQDTIFFSQKLITKILNGDPQ